MIKYDEVDEDKSSTINKLSKNRKIVKSSKNLKSLKSRKNHQFGGMFTKALILRQFNTSSDSFSSFFY